MFITQKAIPRRTMLRGLGVGLALPLLDAMLPAASALANTVAKAAPRAGFIYVPHGVSLGYWKPKAVNGQIQELSQILSALEPFQKQMSVFGGLSHREAEVFLDGGNGEHVRANAVWLSAVRPKRTEGADVRLGTTVDQHIAAKIGQDTAIPSLEVGLEPSYMVGNCDNGYSCTYMNTLAWKNPTTPLPLQNNPRMVFERLFGEGGTAAQRRAEMSRDSSILDAVSEDMARLLNQLGSQDKTTVNEYLDSVRQIEQRIQRANLRSEEEFLPEVLEAPVGVPDSFAEHAEQMYELIGLALQADITRVFTFQVAREFSQRIYPEIGVTDPHHGLSHHQNDPEKLAKLAKVNSYHMSFFAKFLQRLRETPTAEGNLLDQSMILYGSGISDGNMHSHIDLPLVLVGGGRGNLKGNQYLASSTEVPMANLLLSMMDKCGVEVDVFGDSTGRLPI